ncbi:MAG: thioredoxin family protein [Candidatus Kerfeldbacteria bacterium]|nr:thioredoxin family protein [Candidatus Kerfeldbacteria bacterium]
MAKHRSPFKSGLWVIGVIVVTGLLVWGLAALGGRGSGPATTGSNHAAGQNSGAAIYLKPSPAVTASLSNPGKKTVLWFSATWCTICKSMSPYVQNVVERHADQVVITERDVDREPALARQYAVRGTPTFVLLDESGQTMTTRVGHLSESQFESFITQGS